MTNLKGVVIDAVNIHGKKVQVINHVLFNICRFSFYFNAIKLRNGPHNNTLMCTILYHNRLELEHLHWNKSQIKKIFFVFSILFKKQKNRKNFFVFLTTATRDP